MSLKNLNRISWPLIYLWVNISNLLLQQKNITRWDNLVLKTNFRSSIQILPRSVFLLSPLGLLWARFPYKFLKNLKTKLGRISLPSIFTATFAKTASACNTVMEKCQHSIKTTFKRVKSQIQKGADPEIASRHSYQNACDYFEIMNKRILIQQRALACLSKSVAHILQRELYTMGNNGLLRHEAETTLLQPHLGDSRRQELRNSPFWPTPLLKSQLVKDGEDFLLKNGTPNDSQGFGPYQNKPFPGPHHNKKRGSYRKRPYGGNSSKSSNQSFSSGRGKSNNRGFRGRF